MIVLDTNVVSEVMRKDPNPRVFQWLHSQREATLYLAATTLAEVMVGIAILPYGRRKADLSNQLWRLVNRRFATRVLSFDQPAAEFFARLIANSRTSGQAVSLFDGQIAAIASVHRFTVATRDTRPFQACGLPVINPWEHATPIP